MSRPPAGARPLLRLRLRSAPTYWRCEPAWSWHARPLPDYLLWYVLDGAGHLAVAGASHSVAAGTGVLFAPGDEPRAGHDPRRRLLVFGMHFDAAAGEGGPVAPSDVVPPARVCRVRDQELVTALARHCDAGHRRGDELGEQQARLCLEQLVYVLREDATGPVGPADPAVEEITRLIRQDPSRRWTVAELATRASLSRAQFTRRFVAHTQLPPARFVARARMDRARQLLTETNMSVTQVAATLGYADLAHFSRQYKQHTGHSPGRDRG